MPYVTLAEIKAAAGISDTADDAAITLAVDAASAMLDEHTSRSFTTTPAPVARLFTAAGSLVLVDDIATLTGLLVEADDDGDGTYERSIPATGYRPGPLNAPTSGRPVTSLEATSSGYWPKGAGAVRVTATFGWPAVPAAVKQAALIQALRLFQRRLSPYGIAGSPEVGSELRLLSRLDPDVEALVRPYRKLWTVA